MQLVMRRTRLERATWYSFKISARMVLDGEEAGLLEKYKLRSVILTPGDTRRDVKKAAFVAVPIGIILFFIIGLSIFTLLVPSIIGALIYHQIREDVRVSDLLTGRDFKARSLLQLLQKEQAIRKMSGVFANVVAQARTWHEPEVVNLEPQPLFKVLEGERAAA